MCFFLVLLVRMKRVMKIHSLVRCLIEMCQNSLKMAAILNFIGQIINSTTPMHFCHINHHKLRYYIRFMGFASKIKKVRFTKWIPDFKPLEQRCPNFYDFFDTRNGFYT